MEHTVLGGRLRSSACTTIWVVTASDSKRPGEGQIILREARFVVYCNGKCGGDGEKKGQGRVGLAVRTQIIRGAARPPEFISDCLLVTFELCGRAKAVTFVVARMLRRRLKTVRKNIRSGQP